MALLQAHVGGIMANNKKGFTIPEILLVLSLIGVVAGLTIPGLVVQYQNEAMQKQLIASYSILSQATQSVFADNGMTMKGLCTSDGTSKNQVANECLSELYRDKLKVVKECKSGEAEDNCWAKEQKHYTTLEDKWDVNAWNTPSYILANGTSIFMYYLDKDCNYTASPYKIGFCGMIGVDVNGTKLPNIIGRDIHEFMILQDRLVPQGSNKLVTADGGLLGCPGSYGGGYGYGCTAWIIEGNTWPKQ